jgi:hypothetical protein
VYKQQQQEQTAQAGSQQQQPREVLLCGMRLYRIQGGLINSRECFEALRACLRGWLADATGGLIIRTRPDGQDAQLSCPNSEQARTCALVTTLWPRVVAGLALQQKRGNAGAVRG